MQTRYLERPEGTLAYSDYGGSGELVLMLPGMGALRSEYRFLAPKLKRAGFRAVAVDLRGHGESSVRWKSYDLPSIGSDILALIGHLKAGAAHLIGTSQAAGAVVWAAAERPDCVRSLVLIAAYARRARAEPVMKAAYWLMMHNPWRVPAWAIHYRTAYPTRKPADFEDYLDRLKENLAQPGRFAAAMAVGNASLQPADERLRRVQAPTLVIMGASDPDFADPVAEGRYLAQQTGGRLEWVDGAGHYPQTEMPEQTAQILIDFLRAHTASVRADLAQPIWMR